MAGVLAGDTDFAGEREVVADEDLRADDQPGGERLVVGVAEAEDVGVIVTRALAVGDLEQAEVPVAFLGETVRLFDNAHVGGGQGRFDLPDEVDVGDREPRFGARRGGDGFDDFALYFGSATMED